MKTVIYKGLFVLLAVAMWGCETTGSYSGGSTTPVINYETGFPFGSEQDTAATLHNMEVESQINSLESTIQTMQMQQQTNELMHTTYGQY